MFKAAPFLRPSLQCWALNERQLVDRQTDRKRQDVAWFLIASARLQVSITQITYIKKKQDVLDSYRIYEAKTEQS